MFSCRATEPEKMDKAEFGGMLAVQSFRFIEKVNRFLGGARIVRQFIETEASGMPGASVLRILDIGSGSCDIPIAVCRWAKRKGINIHFTCVENGMHAFRLASCKIAEAGLPIKLVHGDIFRHFPEKPYDCAIGSMFFHHLSEESILQLIRILRDFVRKRLLINDLRRGILGYFGCGLLVWPLPAGVVHDALLSVRKSFRAAELRALLEKLDDVSVRVGNAPIFRVKAVVDFGGSRVTLDG